MVWVMGGKKVRGPTGTGRGLRGREPTFHPQKPLNPHCQACPTSRHNSPCGITLAELLIAERC